MTPWVIRVIAGGALDETQLNVMCGAARPRKSPMPLVVVGLGKICVRNKSGRSSAISREMTSPISLLFLSNREKMNIERIEESSQLISVMTGVFSQASSARIAGLA
jgi:tetrahydromethanopterin S-methyltransferase subunit F